MYLSNHLLGVCERLGINVQPARTFRPTDKPMLERFFRTLREDLLQHLDGYKGPEVAARGKNPEKRSFYYVDELQQIIREWVGIYHATTHTGLCDPRLPHVDLSPTEMFARGVEQSGVLSIPYDAGLRYEFLNVAWRTIQHYGVEANGGRYDGPGLNAYRGQKSRYGGVHSGKWPIMFDVDDVRYVYFQDPATAQWHQLVWEHAGGLNAPFSAEAAKYTRELSTHLQRHVDPEQAVEDLLTDWARGEVDDRRRNALALRISAQRAYLALESAADESKDSDAGGEETVRDVASVPAISTYFLQRAKTYDAIHDDLDDVFDAYYSEHPEGGLEIRDD
jgi:putative transposase